MNNYVPFHNNRKYHIIYCSLRTVYPALFQDGNIPPITPGAQAINQLIASIVTLVVALVGGALTGEYYHWF